MKKTKTDLNTAYQYYSKQFDASKANLTKKGLKTSGYKKYSKDEFKDMLIATTQDQIDKKTLGAIKSIPSQQRISQLVARDQFYVSNKTAATRWNAYQKYMESQKALGIEDDLKFTYSDFKASKNKAGHTKAFWNRLTDLRKQGWTRQQIAHIFFGSP